MGHLVGIFMNKFFVRRFLFLMLLIAILFLQQASDASSTEHGVEKKIIGCSFLNFLSCTLGQRVGIVFTSPSDTKESSVFWEDLDDNFDGWYKTLQKGEYHSL